ncbi:hypothetical protein H6A08_06305 [Enorma massiliensis]|uniref:hypothetical protein n=1 Tax=Enorma massiliensis TaxID=1472761 RepID=UPI0008204EAF|nr:hypothetical protein [Enorma massiliensis]MBM6783970.1 hypothetical protein [Enorma massiliensis]SCH39371.1 Uncharacterised protein [uncultured Collinsella sp.]
MAKVMFDVLLPSTGRHYDFWVPEDMPMQQVSQLVAEAMQVAEPDYYEAAPDAALMYVPTGEIQEPSATAAEIGFTDGDAFVLV